MSRILRPGGRFAFVAFELDTQQVAGIPLWNDPVADHRPLLEQAGFETPSYDELPNWRAHVAAGFGAVVAEHEQLTDERDEAAARAALVEASMTLDVQPYSGHVLAVATRF